MNINNKLDNFYDGLFLKRINHEKAFFGLKKKVISFPHKEFERQIEALVIHINKGNQVESLDREKVQKLFFEAVPRIKSTSTKNDIYKLIGSSKPLQNYLDEEIQKLREEKQQDPKYLDDPEHKLNRKIAKAAFALKLGIKSKSAGTGMSGSVFMQDVKGKRLGLFKVTHEKTNLWKWFHDKILSYFIFNQPHYLKNGPTTGIEAEKAAYIVSSKGGFGRLVPPTTLKKFQEVDGSFQLMVKKEKGENLTEFKNITDAFESRDHYEPEEIQMFQEFAVYDYLINNLDRHHGNWMVEYNSVDNKPALQRIHAIDHDRAFSVSNPGSYTLGAKSQYKWKDLKIAKEQLTDQTKDFIQKFTDNKINQIIDAVDREVSEFLTEDMKARMKEKAHVLRKMAENNGSIQDLGNLRNDSAVRIYIYGK